MNENNQIIIYQTEDGQTSIDVKMEGETVWLSQQQMAELFDKDRTVIGRHIRNLIKEGGRILGMCKICTYHKTWCYKGQNPAPRNSHV